MARYDWPGEGDPELRDHARSREEATRREDSVVAGQTIGNASARRSALLAALTTDPDTGVWLPIGPSVIFGEAGESTTHATGRVRDLAVSDDGRRVYAATANGGVWHSSDAGTTWSPLGAGASTPGGQAVAPGPNCLVTTCLSVTFGANPNGSQDIVYAGTGEKGRRTGIGVLKLVRPLPDATAHPEINPWQLEAANLTGMTTFRIARKPGTGAEVLVAATSSGLWKREGAFVAGANWTRVTEDPFDFDADDDKWCTDVVWHPATGGTPERLWVALVDDTLFTDTGIYVSENGVAGPFPKVELGDFDRAGRLAISVHKKVPAIVYVLGKGARLWRIDGTTARKVRNIPKKLFAYDKEHDQSEYDMAVAAHPEKPNEVMIGGSTVLAEGQFWNAALFRLTITGTAAADNYSCNFDPAKQDAAGGDDATYVGGSIHSDVHAIRYAGTPPGSHVWIGTDGGVYQSTRTGDAYTYMARNYNLAVLEAGYVACHPNSDGLVLIGCQDNGSIKRIGDSIWVVWSGGDGGGCAVHPTMPGNFIGQRQNAIWMSSGRWIQPVWRDETAEKSKKDEDKKAAFYSSAHVIAGTGNQARVAIGTNRLWISEDWDPSTRNPTMTWQTLPSGPGKDPRLKGANNTDRDTLPARFGSIYRVLWAGPPGHPEDRLIALFARAVVAYIRDSSTGKWSKEVISRYEEKCWADDEMDNDEIGEVTSSVLPPNGEWADLAVHDPGRGKYGSFYVATTGSFKFDDDRLVEATRMDTLWWFDGTNTWHPTKLRGNPNATAAPSFAVAVDPDDIGIVYVGTSAGVWRGQLTFVNSAPKWEWRIFSNGLPDTRIRNLAFFRNGDLKLLRAALQARGVWEVDVSATPRPVRRTYLRVHKFDARRRFPTSLVNPDDTELPQAELAWFSSPDIVVRPAPGAQPTGGRPGTLPWTINNRGFGRDLWVLQTAMHSEDPLVRTTKRWTRQFDSRIKAFRASHGLANPSTAIIDTAFWDIAVVAGKAFAPPWDGSEPTEADLHELIDDELDVIGARTIVSRVRNVPYKADVLVHHRHFEPVAPTNVNVLMLIRQIDDVDGDGAAVAISDAWKNAVVQRLGGAGTALPDGWRLLGLNRPTGPVAAMVPRAVTFDVDFSQDPPFVDETNWMLLAVVSASTDPATAATLNGGTIRDLVLNSHHVAVRLVRRSL